LSTSTVEITTEAFREEEKKAEYGHVRKTTP
jgi:hypothetical protein